MLAEASCGDAEQLQRLAAELRRDNSRGDADGTVGAKDDGSQRSSSSLLPADALLSVLLQLQVADLSIVFALCADRWQCHAVSTGL